MSSTTNRVPLEDARGIAAILGSALLEACHRIEVAGSIRRQRETIGDIDLVCEPIVKPLVDMFDEPTGEDRDLLTERCNWMIERGYLEKRLNKNGQASWGRDLKRAVYRGMAVDIQSVRDRDSWGFWLLIRTGPADFNKALVTPRWQGGLLPPGFEIKDGFHLYRGGGRVPTPTEESVFDALGLEWLAPTERGARPTPARPPLVAGGGA